MTTRNAIFAALRARLEAELGIGTWFDRPVTVDKIGLETLDGGAAFIIEESETAQHQAGGSVWTLAASLWLHVRSTEPAGPVPLIRGLLEDVEDALSKKPGETAQHKRTTLGGIVHDVRITRVDGDLSGVLDQCVAIVELEIIVPVSG